MLMMKYGAVDRTGLFRSAVRYYRRTDVGPEPYKYWAFVSYSNKDQKWSEWLHRKIERYRVPSRIATNSTKSILPRRLRPLFRDRDELPTSGDLGAVLKRALDGSRSLIVVCSRAAAASQWVNTEIQTFRDLGRGSRILCLIVDGDPTATDSAQCCFPPALFVPDRNGVVASPLGADVRPSGDGKTNAFLKICAGLLEIDFDLLKSREVGRRKRRLAALAATSLALMGAIAFGVLVATTRLAEVQQLALENESRALATRSREEAALSFSETPLALALQGMPHSVTRPERPVVDGVVAAIKLGLTSNRQRFVLRGHDSSVESAHFNGAATRALTVSNDSVRLWSTLTGVQLGEVRIDHDTRILDARFARGMGIVVKSDESKIEVIEIESARTVKRLELPSDLGSGAVSPDGRLLALSSGQSIILHSLDGAGPPVEFAVGKPVGQMAFSRSGRRLTVTMGDSGAVVDLTTRATSLFAGNHAERIQSIEFSPDESRVLTSSDDRTGRIWDARTGELMYVLKGHRSILRYATFSPDGLRVVTTSADNTARIWNAQTGQLIAILRGHGAPVFSASFDASGKRLVTGSADFTIREWDGLTGEYIATFRGHDERVWTVELSSDGRSILSGSNDHTARIWDASPKYAVSSLESQEGRIFNAVFTPDGQLVATAGDDGIVRLTRARDGQKVGALGGHTEAVSYLAFSRDGSRLVSTSFDMTARVWDLRTQTLIAILKGHKDGIQFADFSPDGNRVVTASIDGTAIIWSVPDARQMRLLAHEGPVYSATYDPTGGAIVTASLDGTAGIWDARTGARIATLPHHDVVSYATFDATGKLIATTAHDGIASIWSSAGEHLRDLKGHTDQVRYAAFNREGTKLITASSDYTARIWQVATGRSLAILSGHDGIVTHAEFSPTGTEIISTSLDATVRIWDETGTQMAILGMYDNSTNNAHFGPDGRQVVACSDDGTANIYTLDPLLVGPLTDTRLSFARAVVTRPRNQNGASVGEPTGQQALKEALNRIGTLAHHIAQDENSSPPVQAFFLLAVRAQVSAWSGMQDAARTAAEERASLAWRLSPDEAGLAYQRADEAFERWLRSGAKPNQFLETILPK
jgi:WD40 repeat protein